MAFGVKINHFKALKYIRKFMVICRWKKRALFVFWHQTGRKAQEACQNLSTHLPFVHTNAMHFALNCARREIRSIREAWRKLSKKRTHTTARKRVWKKCVSEEKRRGHTAAKGKKASSNGQSGSQNERERWSKRANQDTMSNHRKKRKK